ncbi:peroxiredoxin family protein [Actinophytocola sp. NPDC049390]|uniref:peroxiredoxin family protein n=1 Tax=Actinophytocola sp. NPDC049390 TaxID=3363894 RepID=UPI0037A1D8D2
MSKTSSKTAKGTPAGKRARQIQTRQRQQAQAAARSVREARDGSSRRPVWIILGVVVVVLAVTVLYLIYQNSPSQQNATAGGSGYQHVAGQPGAGTPAPAFTLPSSSGGEVSLADYRGKSVLLYFQEGLMCQPCWDQITDLERNQPGLTAAGVDAVVSITSDPVNQIAQKMTDMKLSTPTLSDPDLDVIRAYDAHKYGMMGESRAGHSFILVGPDGIIRWRADYGGAPDYTMYLPTQKMLADLTAERKP